MCSAVLCVASRRRHECSKEGVFVLPQIIWRVKLHELAAVHDHDPTTPQHSVEAVGDDQQRAVGEG